MKHNYLDALTKYRTILLHHQIDFNSSSEVIAKILSLNSVSHDPINLYISSPGGCIYSSLQIIDIMNIVESPIYIFCTGLVASAAVVIAVNGTKGYRYASKNCTFMIHQPSSQLSYQKISDLYINLKEGERLKKLITEMLSEHTIKTFDEVINDTDRDKYMTSQEAIDYGIVDKIL